MNKLHLEYLRETGTQPVTDIWDLYLSDHEMSDAESDAVSRWINGISKHFLTIYKTEYVEWLENKLNS
jgi:hypothetical protein